MNIDVFKALTPYEQAVILLLERIARDIETIKKVGEE